MTYPPTMLRSLLCGVSVFGVSAAMPSHAAEWEIGLGAYVEQSLAYASYDSDTASDFDGIDSVGSGEAFFLPSITLDNGIKIGVNIQMEGHVGERNAGADIDEAHIFVKGSFGELLIGKSDTPGNHMSFGAPMGYGPATNFGGISSGSLGSYIPFSGVHNSQMMGDDLIRGTLGSTFVSNMGEETQGRITYFTPRFAGFQLGLSYAHEEPNAAPNRQDFFDIGANYVNSFGDFDVGLSAKWGIADNTADPNASPEYWGAGANLGYGGFTIGGSFAESNNSSNGVTDGEAYDVGLLYQAGKFGYSMSYLHGRNVDNEHAGFGPKERFQAITAAINYYATGHPERPVQPPRPGAGYDTTYGLQKGVGINAFVFASYVKFDEDVGDGGFGTPGDDVDGFVIGTGLKLSF
ncbi:porin [Roseovarius pelagicus]|uniref:Porin n=1 Tax=Roseovarius pelagicus TaxID=2980108 RepID=A0ABY6DDE8_9RHOB|nr:porin [Roseovarius pelagicus]UXX84179.1 porin [Roseovarius pelagicus]